MKQIAILGGGAFGTAMSTVCATNGYDVRLWCFEKEVVESINKNHTNERYLPGVILPESIVASTDIAQVVAAADIIFEAVPVPHLRAVIQKAQPYLSDSGKWVVLSKGIESETLLLPSQIIDEVFDCNVIKAIVSGPSFAAELAQKEITAVTVASKDNDLRDLVCAVLKNDYVRPYLSDDVIGVQVGGALKNVMALGMGLLNGAGYGKNTQAFMFDRGVQEMMLCVQALGGCKETLIGLSGFGDLFLTCTSTKSRNCQFGMRRGQGMKRDAIIKELGTVPEGLNTLVALEKIVQRYKLGLPFLQGVYSMINHDVCPVDFFANIMNRPIEDDVI